MMNSYHGILVPISFSVMRKNGDDRQVQISHLLINNDNDSYATTGIFHLYLNDFGLNKNEVENSLFKENSPVEVPDEKNPAFIGRILSDEDNYWIYDGEFLEVEEQEQIADFLTSYEEGDVAY